MTIALGSRAYIGIGEEGVFGTAVVPDVFLLHNTESIAAEEAKLQAGEIYRTGQNADARAQGRIAVKGGFTYHPRYFGVPLPRLLYHALGAKATARPDITTAPTVYRHTLTPADDLPTGLTIEVCKHLDSHVASGCKVESLRFGFDAGGLMTLAVAVIGQQVANQDLPTSLVYSEGNVISATNASGVLNGVTYKILRGEVSIANSLEPIYVPSQRTVVDIVRGDGYRTITGTFEAYFEDASLWTRFRNMQRGLLTLTFTGGVISGAYNYDLVFTIPVTELLTGTPAAATKGPLTVPVTFQGFLDGGNANECSIRVTNTSSSI